MKANGQESDEDQKRKHFVSVIVSGSGHLRELKYKRTNNSPKKDHGLQIIPQTYYHGT